MEIDLIWEGFRNTIFRTKEIERLAAERKKVCDACPHGMNGVKCKPRVRHMDEQLGVKIESVGGCGCLLSMLQRSPGKGCPKKKFPKIVA